MSILDIRQALENAVNSISDPIDVSWENDGYIPTVGVPYMAVYNYSVPPENPEMGHGFRDVGYLHINIFYPSGEGTARAETKAQQIRDKFPRGSSLQKNNIIVTITRTPSKENGFSDGNFYMIPVKVFWHSNNFN